MLSHHIHADLARERHNTLLAEAEAYHLAKQARLHRQPAGTPGARRSPLHWVMNRWRRSDLNRSQPVPTACKGLAGERP
jgi:hypothetical protein